MTPSKTPLVPFQKIEDFRNRQNLPQLRKESRTHVINGAKLKTSFSENKATKFLISQQIIQKDKTFSVLGRTYLITSENCWDCWTSDRHQQLTSCQKVSPYQVK